MKIKSATFMRGVKGDNDILDDGLPQIAFIGRSNAGKSSVINSLTNIKGLARTSTTAGLTRELNVFMINKAVYFIDLPGYGFAKGNMEFLQKINKLVFWYLFDSQHSPKVVLIIDAEIGMTESDQGMLESLEERGLEIVVVANKVDKIRKSYYLNQLKKIKEQFSGHLVIPFSSVTKVGVSELSEELLGNR
jgi:GTP-binding protein